MVNTNEELISQIEEEFILAYQKASVLGLFRAKDIGHIGIKKWIHMKLDDIPDAALSAAGFNPQEAKLNAQNLANYVYTSAEKIVVSESDWAAYQAYGLDEDAIIMIGSKVAQMASRYLFRGTDADGNNPITQYNFITDAGTGDGTIERPLIQSQATSGGWSTFINKANDLSLLESQLVAKGYNLQSTVVFYPEIAHKPMTVRGSATNDVSAVDYLLQDGILAVVPIPDEYMYTLAGADPTAALFDLIAVDLAQIDIGYTRTERAQTVLPYGGVRTTAIEGEVWFCPYIKPRPWTDGKIYKGVSRITAIAP